MEPQQEHTNSSSSSVQASGGGTHASCHIPDTTADLGKETEGDRERLMFRSCELWSCGRSSYSRGAAWTFSGSGEECRDSAPPGLHISLSPCLFIRLTHIALIMLQDGRYLTKVLLVRGIKLLKPFMSLGNKYRRVAVERTAVCKNKLLRTHKTHSKTICLILI